MNGIEKGIWNNDKKNRERYWRFRSSWDKRIINEEYYIDWTESETCDNVTEWWSNMNNDEMTDNKIGGEGAIKISESLIRNSTLTTLDLSGVIEKKSDSNIMKK